MTNGKTVTVHSKNKEHYQAKSTAGGTYKNRYVLKC